MPRQPVFEVPLRGTGILHRSAVTAVDKLVAITVEAADQTGVVGVFANSEHKVAVAPYNAYGSVGASAIVAVTPTENKTIDVTIPQCAGATHYDIFCSTDAAPKWVARVTEAQRAAGCAVTAVGTVGAGGAAGKVNVRLVGTGLGTDNAAFANNNAYKTANATVIECKGYNTAFINVEVVVTDLRSAPSLTIVPFLQTNGTDDDYYQGTAQAVSIVGGAAQAMKQYYSVDVSGAAGLIVLVSAIAGQGTSANIWVELV